MITIIHGDDLVASRSYYKSLQKKDTVVFDGEKVTLHMLTENLLTTDLFGTEKQVCLENFFSKRKASKEMDAIIQAVTEQANYAEIIFWEGKEIGKKALSTLPKAISKNYILPKSLFTFLDSLKPNNTASMIMLYQKTLPQTDAEMVLVMLLRHIRILLALSDESGKETIDEVKRMQPWQKKKLSAQLRLFSQDKLLQLHQHLVAIEIKSKTGGLPLPLPQSIDFFLSTM